MRVAGICLLMLATGSAPADEQTFVLQEYVNRDWKRELVSFPVKFPKGTCHPRGVSLRGPKGPLPCQLTDVRIWPGSQSVKEAMLWFIADLAKLGRNEYVLNYADAPASEAGADTDLTIARNADQIEMTTKHFGIRLPLGEKAGAPVASDSHDVPGPVLAFRDSAGQWFGGGSGLYGPLKIVSYQAQLTDEGPVLVRWAVRYTYEDGNSLSLSATLAAGDNAVFFEQTADRDAVQLKRTGNPAQATINGRGRADNGLWIGVSRGLGPMVLRCQKEGYLRRPFFKAHLTEVRDWADIPLGPQYPSGIVTNLVPWRDWWSTYTQTEVRLKRTGRPTELRFRVWDCGRWVDPRRPEAARRSSAKAIPLIKQADGEIVMSVSMLAGVRKWSLGEGDIPNQDILAQVGRNLGSAPRLWQVGENDPRVARGLNVVKDWVLDWEEPAGSSHPHMFLSAEKLHQMQPMLCQDRERIEELTQLGRARPKRPSTTDSYALAAFLRSGDLKLGRELELADRLRTHLDCLAEFDIRGGGLYLACLYDGVIDSGLIAPKDRKLLRAQMAYAAYVFADPGTWSFERGYRSGNPNMSVVVDMTRGLIGCMFRSHPESEDWVRAGVAAMKRFMAQVGPKGEWMESAHYSHVSASTFVPFAIAAREAGVHDFFADGELKRLMLYLAKVFTPPDPRRGQIRVAPPWGRSNAGKAYGHSGPMAFATSASDPDYSKTQQWLWKRMGYSLNINYFGQRFGGFEEVCSDRLLPEATPGWASELFPLCGAILRQGVGTKHEHWLGILTNEDTMFVRTSEAGAIMSWYSRGVPIGGAFTGGYDHRHQLFMCTVQPARRRGDMKRFFDMASYEGDSRVQGFAALPWADYLDFEYALRRPDTRWRGSNVLYGPVPEWPPVAKEGTAPMTWRRQAMLVKDIDPAGVSYLVLRDTVRGNQPSMWQFWTLSEKVGTPEEVRDRERFLADLPGQRIVEPRVLQGDRFTAVGQFDMDVEYYVAAPTDGKETPRHTLRYGDRFTYPINGFQEYQDLLHLQLPGDGHYFVCLLPRFRTEAVPAFQTLGDGTVIKITGDFGTDYAFLSDKTVTAQADEATFTGTAGCVQDRKGGVILVLDAAGRIAYKSWALVSDTPVAVHSTGERLTVTVDAEHETHTVRVFSPGTWHLAKGMPEGVRLIPSGKGFTLSVPSGVQQVVLEH